MERYVLILFIVFVLVQGRNFKIFHSQKFTQVVNVCFVYMLPSINCQILRIMKMFESFENWKLCSYKMESELLVLVFKLEG